MKGRQFRMQCTCRSYSYVRARSVRSCQKYLTEIEKCGQVIRAIEFDGLHLQQPWAPRRRPLLRTRVRVREASQTRHFCSVRTLSVLVE